MVAFATFNGTTVANFVVALCEVYLGLILLYVLITVALNFGLRPPYSRWFDTLMNFLRDVCDPYLGLFRRFIPPIGAIDLSPMIAIIMLIIIERILVGILGG
jgi:YggT family protein